MSEVAPPDLRLVLLAATAYLHWRDLGEDPAMMSAAIDPTALAQAIDSVTERLEARRVEGPLDVEALAAGYVRPAGWLRGRTE